MFDTPAHTHHPVGSTGAQCANCHMPERTYMKVDPRRDHSLIGLLRRLFGIVQDVSEKVRYEQRLIQAANADPLTRNHDMAAHLWQAHRKASASQLPEVHGFSLRT